MFLPEHRQLLEEREGQYGGVEYTLTIHEERGVRGKDCRYVEVEAQHVNIGASWRESLEERSSLNKWIPFLREEPLSQEEHIEKVMDSFTAEVDDLNDFMKNIAERNESVVIRTNEDGENNLEVEF